MNSVPRLSSHLLSLTIPKAFNLCKLLVVARSLFTIDQGMQQWSRMISLYFRSRYAARLVVEVDLQLLLMLLLVAASRAAPCTAPAVKMEE